jgi:uncharacterized protein YodC (DUF2158 family)
MISRYISQEFYMKKWYQDILVKNSTWKNDIKIYESRILHEQMISRYISQEFYMKKWYQDILVKNSTWKNDIKIY